MQTFKKTPQKQRRIAIIGAGYAGLSLCFHLLSRRAGEVTLFDRTLKGGGASLISAGLLHPYPGADAYLAKDAKSSFEAAKELLQIASSCINTPVATQTGLVRLAMSSKQRGSFLERAKQHTDLVFFTEEECASFAPHLPPRAGLFIQQALVVEPQKYLEGLKLACEQSGAHFVQQEVHPGHDVYGLNLPAGFDTVVMAMGAECMHFPHFKNIPLKAVKGQILKLAWPKDVPMLAYPMTGDCYLIPKEDALLVGATFEKEFTSKMPDLAHAEALLRPRAEALVPQLAASSILEVQAGVRLTTPQHRPIAMQIAPHLWAFTALGSKGLLYHAALGHTLAQEIVKG